MSTKIQKGFNYFANFVTYPKNQYTAFQVGVKNNDNTYTNYKFFCFERHDWLKDRTKFQLDEIISVELGEWQGKPQFNITANISQEETKQDMADAYLNQTQADTVSQDQGSGIEIDSDDLPFWWVIQSKRYKMCQNKVL